MAIRYDDPQITDLIRDLGKTGMVDQTGRASFVKMYKYAKGDMIEDVAEGLRERYQTRQSGPSASRIAPMALTLLKAWVSEMATTYSGEATYTLKNEEGETDEEATEAYNKELQLMAYSHTMDSAEQVIVPGEASGNYYQFTPDNEIDIQIFEPQDVYPVPPPPEDFFNPANQNTYAGFVIDTGITDGAKGTTQRRKYTFVGRGGQFSYMGRDVHDVGAIMDQVSHGFAWKGEPLNMFAVWNSSKPVDQLLNFFEHSMYTDTRELSIMWSVMFDIMRHQGGATPVKTVTTTDGLPNCQPIGVAFPVINENNEQFNYAVASNDYTGLIAMLSTFAQLLAVSVNLSPGDFSVEGSQAQSGFAKIIENLPKTRQKNKMARWFEVLERQHAYPRLAVMMAKKNVLPLSRFESLRLEVEFEGDDIPESIDEEVKRNDHEFKHGLSSPSRELSKRLGISIEEAEERLAENKRSTGGGQQQDGQPGVGQQPPIFGARPRLAVAGRIGGEQQRQRQDDEDDRQAG